MIPDLLLLQYCLLRLGSGRTLALAAEIFALRTFLPRLLGSLPPHCRDPSERPPPHLAASSNPALDAHHAGASIRLPTPLHWVPSLLSEWRMLESRPFAGLLAEDMLALFVMMITERSASSTPAPRRPQVAPCTAHR